MADPRTKIIDAKRLGEIERLAQVGCNWMQIGHVMGIHERTLRKSAAAKEAYKRGGAQGVAMVANIVLREAAKGQPWACQFYLRTRAGWKDGVITTQQDAPDEDRQRADSVIGIEQRLARIREVKAEVINTEGPEVIPDVVTPPPPAPIVEAVPEPVQDHSRPPVHIPGFDDG
mgnify:CR=1 FL=1